MIGRAELLAHWPVAAFLCPLVFAAIAPVAIGLMPIELFVTLAQLPIYMAHQVEEHAQDRFRRFVNELVGPDALTTEAVAVVNLPGVWGVVLAAFLLGAFVDPAFGLVAAWLSVVNAVIHFVAFAVLRRYNPGLVTAALLLLPAGVYGVSVIGALPGIGLVAHLLAIALVVAIHAAIVVHILQRRARHG